MLGLGNSICANHYPSGDSFIPSQLAGLALWLPYNTGITADQNAAGGSIDHSTAEGNMEDEDKINAWNDSSGNAAHAQQSTQAHKPLWETDSADIGGCNFTGTKYLDLARTITINANTDFTVVVRFKATNTDKNAFIGSSDQEFLRIQTSSKIRLKVNNLTNNNFDAPSGTIATDTYYTLILTRSNGSTGTLNLYIRGGSYTTETGVEWTGGGTRPDGPITITNIGAQADNNEMWRGVLKDVIIYNSRAVTSDERKQLFDYVEGQTNPY
tara:strand:- start:332 stop:1138 length:807 start_codon:yes stop_codon:yes gene_type:complete